MAGSSFGTIFRITTWGESHGPALGVVVDGCPAGLPLSADDFRPLMERRRPNGGTMSTARKEADEVEILSGVFEGVTTGTPISLLIRNTNQHSGDYGNLAQIYRPGHADFGFDTKYGVRDYRGGGRSSGRETAGRVAGGAIAEKILSEMGIAFETRVVSIGGVPFEEAEALVRECRARGDSVGSEVECIVRGVPAGLGDPVFEKLNANLAKAIFSIGAVKSLDIGDGRAVTTARGSENNDAFCLAAGGVPSTDEDGAQDAEIGGKRTMRDASSAVTTVTNHAGGILGGISTGGDIVLRVGFKPTPSISLPQNTVAKRSDGSFENTEIEIHGRHDPVIGPRAAVVVEAMTALVLLDALLLNMGARLDSLRDFYK